MKFKQYITEKISIKTVRGFYKGPVKETGGTSIQGKVAPGIKILHTSGFINDSDIILDYGAGKFGRNANYFRDLGFKVYAYDPFNGKSGVDPYEGVSNKLPTSEKFDVAFTSFVLNVLQEQVETQIINDIKKHSKKQYHLTRNNDIFDTTKKALIRKDKLVGSFFIENFATETEKQQYEINGLSDETIKEFCHFGVQTVKGFQRIPFDPTMISKGFALIKKTSNWKLYKKG